MSADKLVVHSREGVIEVPLTGEPKHDALLTRFALRGGTVTSDDGLVVKSEGDDPDEAARQAMREGL